MDTTYLTLRNLNDGKIDLDTAYREIIKIRSHGIEKNQKKGICCNVLAFVWRIIRGTTLIFCFMGVGIFFYQIYNIVY